MQCPVSIKTEHVPTAQIFMETGLIGSKSSLKWDSSSWLSMNGVHMGFPFKMERSICQRSYRDESEGMDKTVREEANNQI